MVMNLCPLCFNELNQMSATTYVCSSCGQKVKANAGPAFLSRLFALIRNPKTIAILSVVVVVMTAVVVANYMRNSSTVANNQPKPVAEQVATVDPSTPSVLSEQSLPTTVTPSVPEAAVASTPEPAPAPKTITPSVPQPQSLPKRAPAPVPKPVPTPTPTPAPAPTPIPHKCTKAAFKRATGVAASYKKPGLKVTNDSATIYQVNGYTPEQIKGQLNLCSPILLDKKVRYSTTSWWINYSYYSNKISGGKCRMDKNKVAVTLHLRQAFPKWQVSSYDAADLATKWQSFSNGLTVHEKGHKDLANKYAKEVYDGLRAFKDKPCSNFNKEANKLGEAKLSALRKADANYDTKTKHGATQGVVLP